MNKLLENFLLLMLACCIFVIPINQAHAQLIPNLPAASSSNTTDLLPCSQSGTTKKCTAVQLLSTVKCTPFEYYGGSSAATDNSAAWATFVSSIGTKSACLELTPGASYQFTSAISMTLSASGAQNIIIKANGAIFSWSNASGGLTVTYGAVTDSFSSYDWTLVTSQNGGGSALTLTTTATLYTNAQNVHYNFSCRGKDASDGTGTNNYWNYCVYINNVSFVNFQNPIMWGSAASAAGTGIYTVGTNTTTLAGIVYTIQGGDFQNLNVGIEYGAYSQGMFIIGNTLAFNNTNVKTSGPASNTQTQLTIVGNEFETNGSGYGINISGDTPDVIVEGNLFFIQTGGTAIYYGSGQRTNIVGNDFACVGTLTGSQAINVITNDAANAGIISGNIIQSCPNGITLSSTSSGWTVGPNSYYNVTNRVNNNSSSNLISEPAAWTTFTPTISSASGTIGTYTAHGYYSISGKTVTFLIDVAITSVGTSPSGSLTFTIPTALRSAINQYGYPIIGRETSLNGKSLIGAVNADASNGYISYYDNGSPFTVSGGNGSSFVFSGTFQLK